jgi:hypothetical protein
MSISLPVHPRALILMTSLCMVVGAFLFSGASAFAASEHVYRSTFAGEGEHALSDPSGIAVNSETGDVYVVDRGNNRVEWFNSTGTKFEGEFNGSGLLLNEGLNKPPAPLSSPEAIVVDNDAASPSYQDVYVADVGNDAIDKFSATGEYLGQIATGEGGNPFSGILGVAVDAEGKLWVYQESKEIDDYSGAEPNVFLESRVSAAENKKQADPGLAVDSQDDLYVAHNAPLSGEPGIAKLNSKGEVINPPGEVLGGEGPKRGVAVDLSNNDVYLDSVRENLSNGNHEYQLEEFAAGGTPLETFGAEQFADGGGGALAVDSSSHDVYVADTSTNSIDVYAAFTIPVKVDSESVASVEPTAATFEAEIDPGDTEAPYHFEYGSAAGDYEASVPSPDAHTSLSRTDVSVSVPVTGLTPGTTYHYRAVAIDAEGHPVDGLDRTFTTPTPVGSASSEGCANEQQRAEQPYGLDLPDCRAYEQVSPLDKNDTDAIVRGEVEPRASVTGEAIVYNSRGAIAGTAGGLIENYLSSRGSGGWSTRSPSPPLRPSGQANGAGFLDWPYETNAFTPDLSEGITQADTQLTSDAPAGYEELYLANFSNDSYRLVSPNIHEGSAYNFGVSKPWLMGTSTDLSHVVYMNGEQTSNPRAYEWVNGEVFPVSVNNKGEEVSGSVGSGEASAKETLENPGGSIDQEASYVWHAVSPTGSRIFFTSPTGHNQSDRELYVRENAEQPQSPVSGNGEGEPGECTVPADACTMRVSASQRTVPDRAEASAARFVGASADGSKVFFTSHMELTNDANEGVSNQQEIYGPIFAEGTYTLTFKGQTTAPLPFQPSHGELQSALEALPSIGAGNVIVSEPHRSNEKYVSFTGALAGTEQQPALIVGNIVTSSPEDTFRVSLRPRPGTDLYEYDLASGKLTDLSVDKGDLAEGAAVLGVVKTSEDGSYVYFVAEGVLSQNKNSAGSEPVFGQPNLYVSHGGGTPVFIATLARRERGNNNENDSGDWEHSQVNATASLSQDGTRLAFVSERSLTGYDNEPVEPSQCRIYVQDLCKEVYLYDASTAGLTCVSCNPSGARPIGPSSLNEGLKFETAQYAPRNFSEDGSRLFFESSDALVPHDSNGLNDVYEYEGGHLYPISDDAGTTPSSFLDASASGDDVFIATADQLLLRDADHYIDIYDARVGGGFPVSAAPPSCDNGDSCKGPVAPQPGVFGAPASATFSGAGNVTPAPAATKAKTKAKPAKCKRGYVKKKNRCVKKPKAKKSGKRSKKGRK